MKEETAPGGRPVHRLEANEMKNLRHKVQKGCKQKVLTSTSMSIPKKLISMIFGEFCEVLVLTLGKSVDGIEIKEMKED